MVKQKDIRSAILEGLIRKKLSVLQLADLSHVHTNTIGNMLNHKLCNPRLDTLNLVLEQLDLELVIVRKDRRKDYM